LADQLLIRIRNRADTTSLWRGITDRLVEHRYERRATVVLVDNAASGSEEVLDQILRLLYFDPTGATPLTIVLACEPHSVSRIPPPLCEAANLRIELPPWELGDTHEFLTTVMARAGVTETVFHDAAVHRVHLLAQGNPRRVCQLADLALLAGAADDAAMIDEGIVDAVAEELVEIGDR
jgi:type II secretory pathway predicted ATPase ExeA